MRCVYAEKGRGMSGVMGELVKGLIVEGKFGRGGVGGDFVE